MTGQIDILNVGEGDLKIIFNEKDVMETERAKRIIKDMLQRGYALFIHGTDGALIRVKKFLAATNEYLIADGPTVPAEAEPQETPILHMKAKGKILPLRKLKMHKAKATVVGRSAGG